MIEKLRNGDYMSLNELWEIADYCTDVMGPSDFLDAVLRQMSYDELKDCLEYIIRNYEITDDEF